MNAYLNPLEPGLEADPLKLFRKIGDMTDPSPSGIWVVIEEREESINNCLFAPDMDGIYPHDPSQFGWVNWPANYHNGASGLFFADGHAEIHKWLDPRTTPPKGKALAVLQSNPVRTCNDPDAYWLGVRTTAPK